jgi:hypothetical protein
MGDNSPGQLNFIPYPTMFLFPSVKLALRHPSGAWNLDMAPRVLENV